MCPPVVATMTLLHISHTTYVRTLSTRSHCITKYQLRSNHVCVVHMYVSMATVYLCTYIHTTFEYTSTLCAILYTYVRSSTDVYP